MNRRSFFVGAAAAAAAGPLAIAATRKAPSALHQSGAGWFTNAEVQSHDGRTYRFYDDLLKGKIVLINFFFTYCGDVCPLMSQNLGLVQDLLGPRVGKDIFIYSISLQPELDTPAQLAAYAETYGVKPGWMLLTGKPAEIDLLRYRLGFVDSDPAVDADLVQHVGTIRIANEPMHRWIMSPALVDPAAIVRSVKRVIPEAV
jgi:protein SCO1/2